MGTLARLQQMLTAPVSENPVAVFWKRRAHETFRKQSYGDESYPEIATVCNCGAEFGLRIPKPELVLPAGVETGSKAWRHQVFGASLYWYVATMPADGKRDETMLKDKDVLEVGCMR